MASKIRTSVQIQEDMAEQRVKRDENQLLIREAREQFDESMKPLYRSGSAIDKRIGELHDELARATVAENVAPCQPGDVVEDELGVRYRVTETWAPNMDRHGRWIGNTYHEGSRTTWTVLGIRLTKAGAEAHATSRRINSPKLTVVQF